MIVIMIVFQLLLYGLLEVCIIALYVCLVTAIPI